MGDKNREGWTDDSSADDRSAWRSSSGPATAPGRVYSDPRATEPWSGAAGKGSQESNRTEIPQSIKELYGILILLNGPRRFDIFKIEQRRITIGRMKGDILLDDGAVSEQHAVITISGNDASDGEFRILDRGADGLPTKAGTLVNARHINEAVLKDRDIIQCGETWLQFVQLWLGPQPS
jgi:pSer/pThr/pTyr-binding forkhead associated (FHA) protein